MYLLYMVYNLFLCVTVLFIFFHLGHLFNLTHSEKGGKMETFLILILSSEYSILNKTYFFYYVMCFKYIFVRNLRAVNLALSVCGIYLPQTSKDCLLCQNKAPGQTCFLSEKACLPFSILMSMLNLILKHVTKPQRNKL